MTTTSSGTQQTVPAAAAATHVEDRAAASAPAPAMVDDATEKANGAPSPDARETEPLSARELGKAVRRLRHRGGAAREEMEALEARYQKQAALEKEITEVKSGITTSTKALRALEASLRAQQAKEDHHTNNDGAASSSSPAEGRRRGSDEEDEADDDDDVEDSRPACLSASAATPEEIGALRSRLASLKRRYTELTGEPEYRRSKRSASARADKRRGEQRADESLGLTPGPPASTFEPWAPRSYFRFEVVHESTKSRARVCKIHTPHGTIMTPGFVPVATNGALKCVSSEQAADADVQLMFCNTYHLLVHPGADVVEAAGGLHAFARRDAPIITDSGGFQVFSLADSDSDEDGPELKMKRVRRKQKSSESSNNNNVGNDDADDADAPKRTTTTTSKKTTESTGAGQLLAVTERGTRFRSYLDGSVVDLTPESSVAAQKRFGADIIIPLDELPPYHVTPERLAASVALSHRWMARSLRAHLADRRDQAMYAVVHGGVDRDLRKASVEYLASLPFDGFAVGGSLGKDRAEMVELLRYVMPLLPRDKPNHLLGIADPESVAAVVPLGVDTMDSCNPTRVARHGTLYTSEGLLRIKATACARDFRPIDPALGPDHDTLPGYTRAYLHHLFKQNEGLALTLASIHNIKYMNHLMATMREKIMRNEI